MTRYDWQLRLSCSWSSMCIGGIPSPDHYFDSRWIYFTSEMLWIHSGQWDQVEMCRPSLYTVDDVNTKMLKIGKVLQVVFLEVDFDRISMQNTRMSTPAIQHEHKSFQLSGFCSGWSWLVDNGCFVMSPKAVYFFAFYLTNWGNVIKE